ncbi:MAG: PQQ-dependent sugar dehydrogenase [Opitutales bacterium]
MKIRPLLITSVACITVLSSLAEPPKPKKKAKPDDTKDLYTQYCMSCHGETGEGGMAPTFLDDEWKYGSDDKSIAKVIREGALAGGMPPFGALLDEEKTRALVVYIRELRLKHERKTVPLNRPKFGDTVETDEHTFKIEELASIEGDSFWGANFMPDGSILLTGFNGQLFIYKDGQLSESVKGLPEPRVQGQGGMMDAVAHPDYAKNGWIYLAYAELSGDKRCATRVVRGRIKDGMWVDEETILRPDPETQTNGGIHFGGRLIIDDTYVYATMGDRGKMENAQMLDNAYGKIHRVYHDGSIPEDNPFVNTPGAVKSIYTYGNRNPQGIALHPITGDLWESEHGPRGGDEINIIKNGLNYGWPVITHGINYNGKPISAITEKEGMEQPEHYWTPSIAVGGIDFLQSRAFPKWNNDLMVTGLGRQQLHRLTIKDDKVVNEEILFKGLGRLRDVACGPDGYIYLAVEDKGKWGKLARLVPVK